MIHKLILRQARSLAASMELNEDGSYNWQLIDKKTKADFCNIVIAFYSCKNLNNTLDDGDRFLDYMVLACPQPEPFLRSFDTFDYGTAIYDILMRTTACLAHLEAPAFLELFDVEFEGDEVKATLKPEVNWDWAKPEDFE